MPEPTVSPTRSARRISQWLLFAAAILFSTVSIAQSFSGAARFGAWIGAVVAGAWSFALIDDAPSSPPAADRRVRPLHLALVLVLALVVRTAFLDQLPQGASIDEVFTLRNTLTLWERPFAPFGATPLMEQGWVETSNLYLYFNALILKLFGVGYFSLKLFSAIPGVLACGFFYAACARLFPSRVALLSAMLIVFAHWHVRLSRYGWDASFLVMSLAAAVWLLVWSFHGRAVFAYLAGVAAGVGLYSYIAGRLCMLSLVACLFLIALLTRRRGDVTRLIAFVVGAAITSAPLLAHYLTHPAATWVRVGELSVFTNAHPLTVVLENAWWHALMFHVRGGIYARDNYPGLPMLDLVTGILLLVGLCEVVFRVRNRTGLLLCVLFSGTLVGGLFSVSMEGPPYVYRVSPIIVPALLIAAIGLERAMQWIDGVRVPRWLRGGSRIAGVIAACVIALINLYSYFGLEHRSVSAARVMGSEYRLIGQILRRTQLPAVLVVPDVLAKPPPAPRPVDRYPEVNFDFRYDSFGTDIARFAIVAFSGRYDMSRSVAENLANDTIRLMTADQLLAADVRPPVEYVFHVSDDPLIAAVLRRHGNASVERSEVSDAFGNKTYVVLTIRP